MCKEGRYVGLGQRGLREGGGNCLKYFKEGGAEKIGGETDFF